MRDHLIRYLDAMEQGMERTDDRKDWKQNNQIRRDRYTTSIYAGLLVQMADGNQMATSGLPDGNQMEPQYRLGKNSIGKGSIDNRADKPPRAPRFTPPTVDEVSAYCRDRGNKVDPLRYLAGPADLCHTGSGTTTIE